MYIKLGLNIMFLINGIRYFNLEKKVKNPFFNIFKLNLYYKFY